MLFAVYLKMLNCILSLSRWVKYYPVSKCVIRRCTCLFKFAPCVLISFNVSMLCKILSCVKKCQSTLCYYAQSQRRTASSNVPWTIRYLRSLWTCRVITAAVLLVPNLNKFKSNKSTQNVDITSPAQFWDMTNVHLCAYWNKKKSLNRPQTTASKLRNRFQ
jgi:hypothetical protein